MTNQAINRDLIGKLIGMMFSDNENERNTAAGMFVRTFKAAGVHPSDIKLFVFDKDGSFLSTTLADNAALEQQLDDAMSENEALMDEIEKLRAQLATYDTPGWDRFEELCGQIMELKWGWIGKIARMLTAEGEQTISAQIVTNWKKGRTMIPLWVIELLEKKAGVEFALYHPEQEAA